MGQGLAKTLTVPSVLPSVNHINHPHYEELDEIEGPISHWDQEISPEATPNHEMCPDLSSLPPEIAIKVLQNLNATDLCLAACVWQQFATDNILWLGLCRQQWNHCTIYSRDSIQCSYRQIFLQLDEGTLTFNSSPQEGMRYFIDKGIVEDHPKEMAKFFHGTNALAKNQVRQFIQGRQDIVDHLVSLQNFTNTFLPNALRKFFSKLEAPSNRGEYLQKLLERFSLRFCQCNPSLGLSVDSVYVMCFSLILLSVDLSSPHVKNKMSKREFIKNTRGAVVTEGPMRAVVGDTDPTDLYGRLYDNIFLRGHVVEGEHTSKGPDTSKHNFVPGYLAMFL